MFLCSRKRRTAAVWLGILIAVPLARTEERPRVTAVRFWSGAEATRIAIEATGEFHFRAERIPNPNRLFFDLLGTTQRAGHRGVNMISVNDRLLKHIRFSETQRGVTRVVLDLATDVDFAASQLVNPDRLIIELRHAELHPAGGKPATFAPPALFSQTQQHLPVYQPRIPEPPAIVLAATLRPLPVPLAPLISVPPPRTKRHSRAAATFRPKAAVPSLAALATPPPLPPQPPSLAYPAKRSSAGDDSMIRVLGLKIGRVVLDPGHGGFDNGTSGPNGLHEKDLVLDVARRLGALIQERLGSEVVYTRSDDTFIPLEQRTAIANQAHADLFLSIHANSSHAPSAAGVETYYLNFTSDRAALGVAARENAGSQKTVYELRDLIQKIALQEKIGESREFASRIQTSLYACSARMNARARDRGVKKAPFVVLIGASMPSVLAEIGFVSNPHDERLLKQPQQRQKLAEALYRGVAQYAQTLSHFQVAQQRSTPEGGSHLSGVHTPVR